MQGVRILLFVALVGACSFTFLLLACALPQYGVWWPMFVLAFYLLVPIPILIAKNQTEASCVRDICAWLTTVLIFSAYALPILLARAPNGSPVIQWGACALTLTANTFIFPVIFWVLYLALKGDDFFDF
ncbi:hypothetical protein P879_02105 [Paragonimus westermani]|uniref:Leptin receptor overlapping transcript-like 1 n=1 Tax=Paragonimus westermani TaxID=34504 RepID=A0A8T0DS21_9TREM|nr:hypothetical protein P879_02105 [Paragonimus westermani]